MAIGKILGPNSADLTGFSGHSSVNPGHCRPGGLCAQTGRPWRYFLCLAHMYCPLTWLRDAVGRCSIAYNCVRGHDVKFSWAILDDE